MVSWARSLVVFFVVAIAAASAVQPGSAAFMSAKMGAPSLSSMDMQDCDACDDTGGMMSEMSCVTACTLACPAILSTPAQTDAAHSACHVAIPETEPFGAALAPDPFPPRPAT
jgi:hypothetical protein